MELCSLLEPQLTAEFNEMKQNLFRKEATECITWEEWGAACRSDLLEDLEKFGDLQMKRLQSVFAKYTLEGCFADLEGKWIVMTDDTCPTYSFDSEEDAFDCGADRDPIPPRIFTARVGDQLHRTLTLPKPDLSDFHIHSGFGRARWNSFEREGARD
jgi:hypothetical protein